MHPRLLFSLMIALSCGSRLTYAAGNEAQRCFEFERPRHQDPGVFPFQKGRQEPRPLPELWCYRTLEENRIFVFRLEDETLRPESSYLVEVAPVASVLGPHAPKAPRVIQNVIYASLFRGKPSYHKLKDPSLVPTMVPLLPEDATYLGKEIPTLALARFSPDLEITLAPFRGAWTRDIPDQSVAPGKIAFYLPQESQPYAAHWWPYDTLELASGPSSPLGKYDVAVKARTGRDPGALEWERQHHSLEGVAWGGHCNGWAASSVLYKEVPEAVWDAKSKQVFLTSDLNGILAEASFCVQWAFYGRRNYGREGDDPTDIHADLFHKVLRHTLDVEKRPLAMDYMADEAIDNAVITGYQMTITQDEANPRKFNVKASLRRHDYDFERNEELGRAFPYDVDYEYTLLTDQDGHIVSGTWISENPDFLWVPIAQSKCGRENPGIDHRFVESTLLTLPKATRTSYPVPPEQSLTLQPGEDFELWRGPLPGVYPRFKLSGVPTDSPLELIVLARDLYPNRESQPLELKFDLMDPGVRDLELPISMLESVVIHNNSQRTVTDLKIGLTHLESLSGPGLVTK